MMHMWLASTGLRAGYTQQALQTVPRGPKISSNLIWKAEQPAGATFNQPLAGGSRLGVNDITKRNDALQHFDQMVNPYAQFTLASCAQLPADRNAYVAVSRTLENSTAASIATPVTNEELRYELSSVIKKRKKKMRKHKLKKLRRKLKNAK